MVLQKAVDNLKERPKDERKAVAGGIAVSVVAVLIVVWAIFFLKGLQRGGVDGQAAGADELRQIREQSAAQQAQPTSGGQLDYQTGGDPFGY